MNKLFFSPDFTQEFFWNGKALKVGSVTSESRKKISDALNRMSHETIRNRFMGGKKGFTETELNHLTILDGFNHYALGVEEAQGDQNGLAVARVYRSQENPKVGEVGIILVDEYQKLGLGTFLSKLLVAAAMERGIEELSFSYLPQNTGIVKLVKRIHPPRMISESADAARMILDLKEISFAELKAELKLVLPEIENFHLKI